MCVWGVARAQLCESIFTDGFVKRRKEKKHLKNKNSLLLKAVFVLHSIYFSLPTLLVKSRNRKASYFYPPPLLPLSWFAQNGLQNSGLKMKVKESSTKDEDENRQNTTEIITRHTLGEDFPQTVSRGRFPSNRFTCKHTQTVRFLSISPFTANCGHPTHYHMCVTISMSSHTSFFVYTGGVFFWCFNFFFY